MNIAKDIITGVKGFLMGAANVVPGVSGGTIALISGIYSKLIDAINALMTPQPYKMLLGGKLKDFWKSINGEFLLSLAIGVIVSVFSLAKLMEYVLAHYPVQTWAFFFGLIIASAWLMLRDIKDWKAKDVLFTICGIALGLAICTLSPTETSDSLWFIAICGAIAICTMILPGVSGSFILVIFGKYDYIMSAISSMDIPVLAAFAIGCGAGILAFAKALHWLLARYERQTMLILLGFVIGSLVKVWPWNDMSAVTAAQELRTGVPCGSDPDMLIVPAAIWCIIGLVFIIGIDLFSKKSVKA